MRTIIFITVFIDLIGFGIVIPLSPYLAQKMSADPLAVGLLMSVYSLMQFSFSPFWGRLSDRWGRRPIILVSLLGASIAHGLFAMAPTLSWLFFARALAGLFGANISTAMAYIADITGKNNRSAGMGLIGAAFGLGFVLGPFLGGVAATWGSVLGAEPPFGESFPALVASIICLCNFIAAIFFLPESLPRERRTEVSVKPSRLLEVFQLIRRPTLGASMGAYFAAILGMANMEAALFLMVKDRFEWGVSQASWGFAYVGIVMAVVQGGLVRRWLPKFGERRLIRVGFLAAAVGMVFIGISHNLWLTAFAVTVMAFGSGIYNPALHGVISLLSGADEQGRVLGANQSLAALSRVLGPALGGWLYRDIHSSAPFYVASCFFIAAFLIIRRQGNNIPNSAQA